MNRTVTTSRPWARTRIGLRRLMVAGALGLAACGGDGGGTEPPPPAPAYRPVPADTDTVRIVLLSAQTFQVVDAEDHPVAATFYLDAALVGQGTAWTFDARALGVHLVEARIGTDPAETVFAWTVRVTDEGLADVPPPTGLVASPGPIPGSIQLVWNRPNGTEAELQILEYELAYSTAPFTAAAFSDQSLVRFAHLPGFILQPNLLSGLQERVVYSLRVRAIDAAGRISLPEPGPANDAVTFESTGHFALFGVVRRMQERAATILPGNDVLVEARSPVGSARASTASDGSFRIDPLADIGRWSMSVQEASGSRFYVIDLPSLVPRDRNLDLLLVPRGVVDIPLPVNDWPAQMSRLEFLRRMTGNPPEGGIFDRFVTWQSYPIPVYVHPYTFVSAEDTVLYHEAFATEIARWNAAAGEPLLELIEVPTAPDPGTDPSLRGAFYDPTLEFVSNSNLLGEVALERPPAELFTVTPELMRVRLRSNFRTQEVAELIIGHELGHVLGLRHSGTLAHLMAGPPDPSLGGLPQEDEAFVARFLAHVAPADTTYVYREP